MAVIDGIAPQLRTAKPGIEHCDPSGASSQGMMS